MRTLTDHETEATDLFLELIEVPGMTKSDSALAALTTLPPNEIDTDFVHWLSEGTLTAIGPHILRADHLDDNTHPLTRGDL